MTPTLNQWLNARTKKTAVSNKNRSGYVVEHLEAIDMDYIYTVTKEQREKDNETK